jgi:hypothetical protein
MRNYWERLKGVWIYLNDELVYHKSKKNVDLTDKQITIIRDYITNCHQCLIKAGWRMEKQSIGMFTSLAMNNLPELYKKYFEY